MVPVGDSKSWECVKNPGWFQQLGKVKALVRDIHVVGGFPHCWLLVYAQNLRREKPYLPTKNQVSYLDSGISFNTGPLA